MTARRASGNWIAVKIPIWTRFHIHRGGHDAHLPSANPSHQRSVSSEPKVLNFSPLHVATKWGRTNMVELLLKHGAIIDSRTRDLLTPLHCASRSGHDQVVDLLLEKGAPISAKTKVRVITSWQNLQHFQRDHEM